MRELQHQDDVIPLAEVYAEMAEVWVRAGHGEVYHEHGELYEHGLVVLGYGLGAAIDREIDKRQNASLEYDG